MARKKFNSVSSETSKPSTVENSDNKTSTKEKRQEKDKRNIIRAKRPASVKLNKRLLHQERAAKLRAEGAAPEEHRANRHLEEEDALGTRWSVLQNLDSINDLDKKKPLKRSRSKSSGANTRVLVTKKSKRAEPENSDVEIESDDGASDNEESEESSAEESASEESSEEDENNGHELGEDVDHEAIISQLKKEQAKGKKTKWFDGVDERLLDDDLEKEEAVEVDMDGVEAVVQEGERRQEARINLTSQRSAVALDCEMVGVGEEGHDSCLARVSLVDRWGATLYDKYVRPPAKVTDFRTKWSGIRPEDLEGALPFNQVQREVAALLKNRLLVAHSVKNDLSVLMLSHPGHLIRDTSTYDKFRKRSRGFTPSLRNLAREFLQTKIQEGEHDSVVDARTTMQLYALVADEWEAALAERGHTSQRKFSKLNQKRVKRRSKSKTGRGINVKGKKRAKKVSKNKGYY